MKSSHWHSYHIFFVYKHHNEIDLLYFFFLLENSTEECVCVCYATNQPIDRTELQAKIDKLVEELTISKTETSRK